MTINRREDRRISRTRQLLRQAFMDLVREKGFAAVSIQDVAERANVNRGTFYIHYTDKYELLDTIIREEFRRGLALLPADCTWNRESLHLLIVSLLTTFEGKYQHDSYKSHVYASVGTLLDQAVHDELAQLLLGWLKQSNPVEAGTFVSPEVIANIVSWAIFGPVLHWSQQPLIISAEQMAHDILLVITEGILWGTELKSKQL